MEIRYPIIIILILVIIICFFKFSRKNTIKFKDGSKIANTKYLKKNIYYQQIINKYKKLKNFLIILFIIAIFSSTLLISRIAKIETINKNQFNRDIFLCMDVSTSVNDLNYEIVETLKNTVKNLNGERFGISIFNTSSIVLIPLTDDYNYVIETLDKMGKSIKLNESNSYSSTDYYLKYYLFSGTTNGYETRGSSLIGDGLASCIYSFPDLKNERTKIIILSTDNDLSGTPIVTLNQAAKLSKENNIKLYTISPDNITSENKEELKNATKIADGKFYEQESLSVTNIVNDIETTSKSLLKNQSKLEKYDIPQIPFIILVISIGTIIIISKKVIS